MHRSNAKDACRYTGRGGVTNDRATLQPWLSKSVLESHDGNILESATLLSLPQRRQETNENRGKGKENSTGQLPKAHADTQAEAQ